MMQESYERLLDAILNSNPQNHHFIYSVLMHQKASSRHCLFSKPQRINFETLGNVLKELRENKNSFEVIYP
jgi:hypothetical protein